MSEPAPERWEAWSPASVPHVLGRYRPRVWDDEAGSYEPQDVEARCTVCRETYRYRCDSGRVRDRIATWALLHLHRDPLASPAA